MKTPKCVKDYWKACDKIAEAFVEKYFPDGPGFDAPFWIGDQIGEVLAVNDYFFDLNVMVDALKFNTSEEELFGWYDHVTVFAAKGQEITSLRNYLKLNSTPQND